MLCDQFVEERLVEQSIAFYLLTIGTRAKAQEVIQTTETQTKRSKFTMMADSTVAF